MMIFSHKILKRKKVWITICTFFLLILYLKSYYLYDDSSCELNHLNSKLLGHRGLSGYFPESSMNGFLESLNQNITDLEMDVVMTKDSILIISHDKHINSKFCKNEPKTSSINDLTFKEIKQAKCSNTNNFSTPDQRANQHSVIALSELLDTIAKIGTPEINFFIEIKSPNLFSPISEQSSSDIVDNLINEFKKSKNNGNLIVQSFSTNILNEINSRNQGIKTCYLVSNIWTIDYNLSKLNFKPDYYALYHILLNKSKVEKLKTLNIKSIAWTVNRFTTMKRLSCIGVDKIMSDYPLLKYNSEGTPVHNIR